MAEPVNMADMLRKQREKLAADEAKKKEAAVKPVAIPKPVEVRQAGAPVARPAAPELRGKPAKVVPEVAKPVVKPEVPKPPVVKQKEEELPEEEPSDEALLKTIFGDPSDSIPKYELRTMDMPPLGQQAGLTETQALSAQADPEGVERLRIERQLGITLDPEGALIKAEENPGRVNMIQRVDPNTVPKMIEAVRKIEITSPSPKKLIAALNKANEEISKNYTASVYSGGTGAAEYRRAVMNKFIADAARWHNKSPTQYVIDINKTYPDMNFTYDLMQAIGLPKATIPTSVATVAADVTEPMNQAINLITTGKTLPDPFVAPKAEDYTPKARAVRAAKTTDTMKRMGLADPVELREINDKVEMGIYQIPTAGIVGGGMGGTPTSAISATRGADATAVASELLKTAAVNIGDEQAIMRIVNQNTETGDWVTAKSEIATKLLPVIKKAHPNLSEDDVGKLANRQALRLLAAMRNTGQWNSPIYINREDWENGELRLVPLPNPANDVEIIGVSSNGQIISRQMTYAAALVNAVAGSLSYATVGGVRTVRQMYNDVESAGVTYQRNLAEGKSYAEATVTMLRQLQSEDTWGDFVKNTRLAAASQADLISDASTYAEKKQLSTLPTSALVGLAIIAEVMMPGAGEVGLAAKERLIGDFNRQSILAKTQTINPKWVNPVNATMDALLKIPGMDYLSLGSAAAPLRTLDSGVDAATRGQTLWFEGKRAEAIEQFAQAESASESILRNQSSTVERDVEVKNADGSTRIEKQFVDAGTGPLIMETVDRLEGEITRRVIENRGGSKNVETVVAANDLYDYKVANALNRLGQAVTNKWSMDVNLSNLVRRTSTQSYATRFGVASDLKALISFDAKSVDAAILADLSKTEILRGISDVSIRDALKDFNFKSLLDVDDKDVPQILYDYLQANKYDFASNPKSLTQLTSDTETLLSRVKRESEIGALLADKEALVNRAINSVVLQREIRTTASAVTSHIARRTGGKQMSVASAETEALFGDSNDLRLSEATRVAGERSAPNKVSIFDTLMQKYGLRPDETKLSATARSYLPKIEAMANVGRTEAIALATLADARAKTWSDITGRPIDEWWRTRISDIRTVRGEGTVVAPKKLGAAAPGMREKARTKAREQNIAALTSDLGGRKQAINAIETILIGNNLTQLMDAVKRKPQAVRALNSMYQDALFVHNRPANTRALHVPGRTEGLAKWLEPLSAEPKKIIAELEAIYSTDAGIRKLTPLQIMNMMETTESIAAKAPTLARDIVVPGKHIETDGQPISQEAERNPDRIFSNELRRELEGQNPDETPVVFTVDQVADYLNRAQMSGVAKQIVAAVIPLVPKNVKVTFSTPAVFQAQTASNRPVPNAIGRYIHAGDTVPAQVWVSSDLLDLDPIDRGNLESTLIHELTHAATVEALKNPVTKAQKKFANDIAQIYADVVESRPNDVQTQYGLSDPYEFIAEVFSNAEFCAYLKTVDVTPRKTVWTKLLEAFASLLGFNPENNTALAATMNTISAFITASSKAAGREVNIPTSAGTYTIWGNRLYSSDAETLDARGSVEFAPRTGAALIEGYARADATTFVHELAHVIRSELSPSDMDRLVATLNDEYGIEVGHDNQGNFIDVDSPKSDDASVIVEDDSPTVVAEPATKVSDTKDVKDTSDTSDTTDADEKDPATTVMSDTDRAKAATARYNARKTNALTNPIIPDKLVKTTPEAQRKANVIASSIKSASARVEELKAELTEFDSNEMKSTKAFKETTKKLETAEARLSEALASESPVLTARVAYTKADAKYAIAKNAAEKAIQSYESRRDGKITIKSGEKLNDFKSKAEDAIEEALVQRRALFETIVMWEDAMKVEAAKVSPSAEAKVTAAQKARQELEERKAAEAEKAAKKTIRPKIEEPKVEVKATETKVMEKVEEVNPEELKAEEPKSDETKVEEPVAIKVDSTPSNQNLADEAPVAEAVTPTSAEPTESKKTRKKKPVAAETPKKPVVEITQIKSAPLREAIAAKAAAKEMTTPFTSQEVIGHLLSGELSPAGRHLLEQMIPWISPELKVFVCTLKDINTIAKKQKLSYATQAKTDGSYIYASSASVRTKPGGDYDQPVENELMQGLVSAALRTAVSWPKTEKELFVNTQLARIHGVARNSGNQFMHAYSAREMIDYIFRTNSSAADLNTVSVPKVNSIDTPGYAILAERLGFDDAKPTALSETMRVISFFLDQEAGAANLSEVIAANTTAPPEPAFWERPVRKDEETTRNEDDDLDDDDSDVNDSDFDLNAAVEDTRGTNYYYPPREAILPDDLLNVRSDALRAEINNRVSNQTSNKPFTRKEITDYLIAGEISGISRQIVEKLASIVHPDLPVYSCSKHTLLNAVNDESIAHSQASGFFAPGYGTKYPFIWMHNVYFSEAGIAASRTPPEVGLIHELTHAATHMVLSQPRNAEEVAFVNRITEMHKIALDHYNKINPDQKPLYGLANTDEFVAEIFSNDSFCKYLNTIVVEPGQSCWSKLVQAFAALFGFDSTKPTVLSESVAAISSFISQTEISGAPTTIPPGELPKPQDRRLRKKKEGTQRQNRIVDTPRPKNLKWGLNHLFTRDDVRIADNVEQDVRYEIYSFNTKDWLDTQKNNPELDDLRVRFDAWNTKAKAQYWKVSLGRSNAITDEVIKQAAGKRAGVEAMTTALREEGSLPISEEYKKELFDAIHVDEYTAILDDLQVYLDSKKESDAKQSMVATNKAEGKEATTSVKGQPVWLTALDRRSVDKIVTMTMRKPPFSEIDAAGRDSAATKIRAVVELMRDGNAADMAGKAQYADVEDILSSGGTKDEMIEAIKKSINEEHGVNISSFEHKTKTGRKLFQTDSVEIVDKRFYKSVLQEALTRVFKEAKSIKGISLLNQLKKVPGLKQNELRFTGLEQKLTALGQKPITFDEAMNAAANSYEYSLRIEGGGADDARKLTGKTPIRSTDSDFISAEITRATVYPSAEIQNITADGGDLLISLLNRQDSEKAPLQIYKLFEDVDLDFLYTAAERLPHKRQRLLYDLTFPTQWQLFIESIPAQANEVKQMFASMRMPWNEGYIFDTEPEVILSTFDMISSATSIEEANARAAAKRATFPQEKLAYNKELKQFFDANPQHIITKAFDAESVAELVAAARTGTLDAKQAVIKKILSDYKYSAEPAAYRTYMLPGTNEVNLLLDLDNNPNKEGTAIPTPTVAQLAQAEALANTPQGQAMMNTQQAANTVSIHFGKDNLAHARGNTQIVNGKKYFFLQEIQSDIMQAINAGKVQKPTRLSHPDTADWTQAMTRAAIKYAVETGHEGIILPDASVIMPYNLSLPRELVGNEKAIQAQLGPVGTSEFRNRRDTYDGASKYYKTVVVDSVKKDLGAATKEIILPKITQHSDDSLVDAEVELWQRPFSANITPVVQQANNASVIDATFAETLQNTAEDVVYYIGQLEYTTVDAMFPELADLSQGIRDQIYRFRNIENTVSRRPVKQIAEQANKWFTEKRNKLLAQETIISNVGTYETIDAKLAKIREIIPSTPALEQLKTMSDEEVSAFRFNTRKLPGDYNTFLNKIVRQRSLLPERGVSAETALEAIEAARQEITARQAVLMQNEFGYGDTETPQEFIAKYGEKNILQIPNLTWDKITEQDIVQAKTAEAKTLAQQLSAAVTRVEQIKQDHISSPEKKPQSGISLQAIDFTPEIREKYSKPQPLFQPESESNASRPGIKLIVDDSKYSDQVRKAEETWAEVVESVFANKELPPDSPPIFGQVADIIRAYVSDTARSVQGMMPAESVSSGRKLLQSDDVQIDDKRFFKSVLQEALPRVFGQAKQMKAASLLNQLKRVQGLTRNEMLFTGLEQKLTELGQKPITLVEANEVAAKSNEYSVRVQGGDRETFEENKTAYKERLTDYSSPSLIASFGSNLLPGDNTVNILLDFGAAPANAKIGARHFGDKNLAHLRGNTQIINDKKYFFIQEIQSDRMQSINKDAAEFPPGSMSHPTTADWTQAMVRAGIRYAVETGHEGVILPDASVIMPYNLKLEKEFLGNEKAILKHVTSDKRRDAYIGASKYYKTVVTAALKKDLGQNAVEVNLSKPIDAVSNRDYSSVAQPIPPDIMSTVEQVISAETIDSAMEAKLQDAVASLRYYASDIAEAAPKKLQSAPYSVSQKLGTILEKYQKSADEASVDVVRQIVNKAETWLKARYKKIQRQKWDLEEVDTAEAKQTIASIEAEMMRIRSQTSTMSNHQYDHMGGGKLSADKFIEKYGKQNILQIPDMSWEGVTEQDILQRKTAPAKTLASQLKDAIKETEVIRQDVLDYQNMEKAPIKLQAIDFTPAVMQKYSKPQPLFQSKDTPESSEAIFRQFMEQFDSKTASSGPFGKVVINPSSDTDLKSLFDGVDLTNPMAAQEAMNTRLKAIKNELTNFPDRQPQDLVDEQKLIERRLAAIKQTPEYKTALLAELKATLAADLARYGNDIPKAVASKLDKLRKKIDFLEKDLITQDMPTPLPFSGVQSDEALNLSAREIAKTVPEKTVSDKFYQQMVNSPKWSMIGGFLTGFGADEKWAQRSIPPEARSVFMTAVRPIQETISDISRLITEGSENLASTKQTLIEAAVTGDVKAKSVFEYLNGRQIKFGSGMPSVTSGVNHVDWAVARIQSKWHGMDIADQNIVQRYFDACGIDANGNVKTYVSGLDNNTASAAAAILNKLLVDADKSDARSAAANPGDLFIGMAKQSVWPNIGVEDAPKLHAWLMSLFHAAEVIEPTNPDAGFVPNPDQAIRLVSAMSYNVSSNIEAPHHAAVWLATHGGLQHSRNAIKNQAFGIPKEDAGMFDKWKRGQYDPKMDYAKMDAIARKYGLTATFELAPELGINDVMLPSKLRAEIRNELLHGRRLLTSEEQLALQFGADPQKIFAGEYKADFITSTIGSIVMGIRKSKVLGLFFNRPQGFTNDTIGIYDAVASNSKFKTAAATTIQRSLQLAITNTPFLSDLLDALGLLARFTGSNNNVAKIQTKIRRALSNAGDNVSKAMISASSAARNLPLVTEIIDGSTEKFLEVNGTRYSHYDLRQIWLQEGVFATFERGQTSEALFSEVTPKTGLSLEKRARRAANTFSRYRYEQSNEAGTFVRVGVASAYLQMGYDPRTAARAAVATTFDYVNSTTGWDKNLIYNIFFPFQAFRKNNARFIMNRLTTYDSIRKVAMTYRLLSNIPDALEAIAIAEQREDGNEYGVKVNELSEDAREEFNQMRLILEEGYSPMFTTDVNRWPDSIKTHIAGSPEAFEAQWQSMDEKGKNLLVYGYRGYDNVPLDIKQSMNMFFSGATRIISSGQPSMLDRRKLLADENILSNKANIPVDEDAFASRTRFMYDYQLNRPSATFSIESGPKVDALRAKSDAQSNRTRGGTGTDTTPAIVGSLAETMFMSQANVLGVGMALATLSYRAGETVSEGIFDATDEDLARWKNNPSGTFEESDVEPDRASPYYSIGQFFDANAGLLKQINDPERTELLGDVLKMQAGEERAAMLHPLVGEFFASVPGGFGVTVDTSGVEPKYYLTPEGKLALTASLRTFPMELSAMLLRSEAIIDAFRESPKTQSAAAVQDAINRGDYADPATVLYLLKSAGFQVNEQAPSSVISAAQPRWSEQSSTPR